MVSEWVVFCLERLILPGDKEKICHNPHLEQRNGKVKDRID
jgi:hypothetical protein